MPHNARAKPATQNEEPEGYQLIAFVGQISTLDTEDEWLWERDRVPFGFQAPSLHMCVQAPELSSDAWSDWLGGPDGCD